MLNLQSLNLYRTAMAHFYMLLRQTYDRTYDNLMTNPKIFFVIWPIVLLSYVVGESGFVVFC